MEDKEPIKRITAPIKPGRGWIAVVAFIVLLAGLTVAAVLVRRANGGFGRPAPTQPVPAVYYDETPAPVTPEPVVTPEATSVPTDEPSTAAPTAQSFNKTAIVVNGSTEAVVSSRQAAEELIRNVQRHFEDLGQLPSNTITELLSDVQYVEVPEDTDAMSYDDAFRYFTGESTPLLFASKATYVEDSVIPHTDRIIVDSMLPKGLRVVRLLGRDGIRRKVYSATYLNGVMKESGVAEDYTLLEPINGDVRLGGREFPEDYEVKPGFGSDPVEAHYITYIPPVNGVVFTYYGPYRNGFHHGIDIAVPVKTHVKAAAKGTVVSVLERGSYGLVVEIEHDYGIVTRYSRLADANVSIGDEVMQGDIIGRSFGSDSKPHLHFELRIRGTAYNPLKILSESVIRG